MDMDLKCSLLRHTLATLAYRATRAIEGASESFADFDGAGRTPRIILAHMGDLLDWALSMAEGSTSWQNSTPLGWEQEKQRFYRSLKALDTYLSLGAPIHAELERLLQGPVADALTHVGQIAMLRRLAGCPIHGENFFVADIAVGRLGPEQAAPVKTF
jgi:hypothetical protein